MKRRQMWENICYRLQQTSHNHDFKSVCQRKRRIRIRTNPEPNWNHKIDQNKTSMIYFVLFSCCIISETIQCFRHKSCQKNLFGCFITDWNNKEQKSPAEWCLQGSESWAEPAEPLGHSRRSRLRFLAVFLRQTVSTCDELKGWMWHKTCSCHKPQITFTSSLTDSCCRTGSSLLVQFVLRRRIRTTPQRKEQSNRQTALKRFLLSAARLGSAAQVFLLFFLAPGFHSWKCFTCWSLSGSAQFGPEVQ